MVVVVRRGEIVDVDCSSALEFLTILNPLTGVFVQPPTFLMYVFRGVTSIEHALLPVAYRETAKLLTPDYSWVSAPLSTISEQCLSELLTIRRFFDVAARHGIRLPEDSQRLRADLDAWESRLLHVSNEQPAQWPPAQFLSLIALAQHYGVPTRALDCTWSPLVAAYFASRDVMRASSGRIAVWVFNQVAKQLDQIVEAMYPVERPLSLFTAPGADNDNLRAQQGAFMLQVHRIFASDTPFKPQSYDTLLRASLPSFDGIAVHLVTRVTLPCTEAARVIAFLSAANITGASLFPGLWGVAREIQEQQLLDESGTSLGTIPSAEEIASEIRRVFDSGA